MADENKKVIGEYQKMILKAKNYVAEKVVKNSSEISRTEYYFQYGDGIAVWNPYTLKEPKSLLSINGICFDIVADGQGNKLFYTTYDASGKESGIYVYDIKTNTNKLLYKADKNTLILAIAISPKQNNLYWISRTDDLLHINIGSMDGSKKPIKITSSKTIYGNNLVGLDLITDENGMDVLVYADRFLIWKSIMTRDSIANTKILLNGFLNIPNIKQPIDLAIDQTKQIIYWLEQKNMMLKKMSFDAKDIQNICKVDGCKKISIDRLTGNIFLLIEKETEIILKKIDPSNNTGEDIASFKRNTNTTLANTQRVAIIGNVNDPRVIEAYHRKLQKLSDCHKEIANTQKTASDKIANYHYRKTNLQSELENAKREKQNKIDAANQNKKSILDDANKEAGKIKQRAQDKLDEALKKKKDKMHG